MPLSDLQNFCNVLQNRIKAEYAQYDVFFAILSEDRDYDQAFESVAHNLLLHPAGKQLKDRFHPESGPNFITAQKSSVFSRMGLHRACTVCVVFVDPEDTVPDPKTGAAIHVYNALFSSSDQNKNDSLKAHIFATLYRAFDGAPEAINDHASACVHGVFERKEPESSALMFPVVCDVVRTVFEKKHGHRDQSDAGMVHMCQRLAHAVAVHADPRMTDGWERFIKCCQSMVRDGFNPEKITGTAIFSCKDVHLRMAAYLAIERGNITPYTMTTFDFDNPFTNEAINATIHS